MSLVDQACDVLPRKTFPQYPYHFGVPWGDAVSEAVSFVFEIHTLSTLKLFEGLLWDHPHILHKPVWFSTWVLLLSMRYICQGGRETANRSSCTPYLCVLPAKAPGHNFSANLPSKLLEHSMWRCCSICWATARKSLPCTKISLNSMKLRSGACRVVCYNRATSTGAIAQGGLVHITYRSASVVLPHTEVDRGHQSFFMCSWLRTSIIVDSR